MVKLTRLSGPVFALNPDLIERAEATPDTVVTLVNGSKYVVRETLDELVQLISAYRADIISAAQVQTEAAALASLPTYDRGTPVQRKDPAAKGTVVALRPGGEG
jgi:flagellar protein FlbD